MNNRTKDTEKAAVRQDTIHRVIMLGTDHTVMKGGIGAAVPGYLAALENAELLHEFVPTYRAGSITGKLIPAVKAVGRLKYSILSLREQGFKPVVYGHAGAWRSMLRESLVLRCARRLGAKTMLQLHAPTVDNYLNSRIGVHFMKMVCSAADITCVLTPWWETRLHESGVSVDVKVIPNPLPPTIESIARARAAGSSAVSTTLDRSPQADTCVLVMARLVRGKGVMEVLKAFHRLAPHFKCKVAGDGPERGRLERYVRKCHLSDRVEFVGWVSGSTKEALWEWADIFCLPSSLDSFGMVFVEAMAHGLPVVAKHTAAVAEVVANGESGMLVNGDDPEMLAAALQRFASAKLREESGAAGIRHVLRVFSKEAVGARLKKIIMPL